MSRIDYMKVIDLIAKTLKADKNVEVTNPEKEFNIFKVKMSGINRLEKVCQITLNEYDMDIVFKKTNFQEREYEKWLPSFEYELEQEFIKNIKIELDEDVANYKIRVSF